jgi:hypothetical protein
VSQIATGAALPAVAALAAAPRSTTPSDADLGVRVARGTLPHIDRLLTEAHTQGPQLAWRLHLDPGDTEAKAALDKLTPRIKAWQKVLEGFLEDPELPADLVDQFKDEV